MTDDAIAQIDTFPDLQSTWSSRGLATLTELEGTTPGSNGDRDYYRLASLVLVQREAVDILNKVIAGKIPASKAGDVLDGVAVRLAAGRLSKLLGPNQEYGFLQGLRELRLMANEARWTASAVTPR